MKPVTRSVTKVTKSAIAVTEVAVSAADDMLDTTQETFERTVAPVRKQFSRRFPLLFFGFVLVGVTATFLGIEQILLQNQLLKEYPWLILLLGLTLLAITGTLYKKLG